MSPNLERLRKILTTLLIDYSEEEIEATLAEIPSNYKRITRKHMALMAPEQKIYIKIKGVDDAGSGNERVRGKGFDRQRKPATGFKGDGNNVNNAYKW